jgi:hypothetical protein
VTVPVEPTVPRGRVTLKLRYFGDPACSARTLIYIETSTGEELPLYGFLLPPAADRAVHEVSFSVNSAKGVRAILIKRGDAGELLTVPVLSIDLEQQPPQPVPSLRAYLELLDRPAPSGVDRTAARTWIREADAAALEMDSQKADERSIRVVEWLAAESRLAYLDDQVEYLHAAATVLRTHRPEVGALRDAVREARDCLGKGDADAAHSRLGKVEARISPVDLAIGHGRSVLPQKQPVLVTWSRNWSLAGFREEPTPLAITWRNGLSLALSEDAATPAPTVPGNTLTASRAEYAAGFTCYHSWTGNVWDGPAFRLTATVLTPLVLIDRISRPLDFTLSGLEGGDISVYAQHSGKRAGDSLSSGHGDVSIGPGGAAWVGDAERSVLLIPTEGLLLVREGGQLRIRCGKGSALAVVALPPFVPAEAGNDDDAALGSAVRFWSSVAAAPPVQCVQTYESSKLTLHYLYENREHPGAVKPVRIAPLPPLALLAQESGWNAIVGKTAVRPALWRDDRFSYLRRPRLTLRVPPQQGSGLRGINSQLGTADERRYQELAGLGATSIRLLIGKEEELDSLLVQHLDACRKAGLKATIDLHYGPYGADQPQEQARLIGLWEKVARLCSGSRDVLKAYDLKNEPPEDSEVWLAWAQTCIDAIRAIDPTTPILVEAAKMANPSGFAALRPLKGSHLIYGVHVYYPHGFTHGRIFGKADFGSPEAAPARFYPGWITPIDWAHSRETWFEGGFEWWDRWELEASCLPVREFLIRHRLPLDVGEFGVVGYLLRDTTQASSVMWLQDAIDLFETWGASWDVWSYEHGYTWYPGGKERIAAKWQELNRRQAGAPAAE